MIYMTRATFIGESVSLRRGGFFLLYLDLYVVSISAVGHLRSPLPMEI